MDGSQREFRADRHPGDTYDDILNRDTRAVPNFLREGRLPDNGTAAVATSRYTDPEFLKLESKYVWNKIWQMACRVDDIPKVGDYHLYEILGKSLIVVRTSKREIKALYNVCLHRGRKLVTGNGSRKEFKCPYHGMTWNSDGSFKSNPIAWDFPQWAEKDCSLPEAKVDTWGGFVFINLDPHARPLLDYIQPLADDFEAYGWESRYRSLWVQKKVRCNWKVLAEAFMESHHSLTTHPQLLPTLADANSQYDLPNDWVSRHFSASAIASPFIDPMTEQDILDYAMAPGGRRRGPVADVGMEHTLPVGETARSYMAELTRKGMKDATKEDYSEASDAEMLDALLYNVFPNLSVWAGYGPKLTYRWRPNGTDVNSAIMDIMMYTTPAKGEAKPQSVPMIELDFDEMVSGIKDLGIDSLAAVFDQDFSNLPHVQTGLISSGNGEVHFAKYSEMRIRHLHKMIDRYIAEGMAAVGEI